MPEANRKLAAILAADVADYSASMAADEERMLAELRLLRGDVLSPLVENRRGTIVKSMGDGWLIEFESAANAVECAISLQERTAGRDLVRLRIGIHVGDVTHEDEDIFGDGVNIAARLQQIARPGGILVSDSVRRSLDERLGAAFADLGARTLRHIPSAIVVHGWRGADAPPAAGDERPDASWTEIEPLVAALARTGDRAAFGELVARHQSHIRNLMRRACGDRALADDLAQQAFLQAWRKIGQLRQTTRFSAWLKRLAINTWLERLRKSDALSGAAEIEETDLEHPPPSGATLDLDRALGLLPGPVRLCIVLSYHEGMSHAEIAETTGLPTGTVKSHIRRGAERLKALLSDYRPHAADEETS